MGDPAEKGALDEAKELLSDELNDGPRQCDIVQGAAKQAGISLSTLRRAKDVLGIKSVRMGFGKGGKWAWRLPVVEEESYEVVEREAIQSEAEL
jgi:hypothetical protein